MTPASPTAIKTASVPTPVAIPTEPQVLQSQDLVASLPAPVFRLLVIFAYPISTLRTALEIICWKPGRRVQSWMLVGAWWGICLGSKHVFRWLLPALVFLPLIPLSTLRLKSTTTTTEKDGKTPTQSVTTETVLITLHDLHSIHALLPPSPLPSFSSIYTRFRQLGAWRLTRGLVVIWATWVILGHIIGFRTLLAILGSIILLLPSPSLAHLVDLLSKSLAVRRALALAFLFTFGSPPEQSYRMTLDFSPSTWIMSKWAASRRPSLAFSFRPTLGKGDVPASAIADDEDEDDGKVENPIYFRFEVHENQRWWMGLDWTSALLPQERPSWCDSHLLPVSPPPSFTLPPPASIILPAPTANDPHAKVKRTATWRWLDDDWSTVRAGQGSTNATVIHPPPIAESEASGSGHAPRSLSMSFGTSPPPHQDDANANANPQNSATSSGVRAQSIAEQAFAKGLERLKARTGTPQGKPPSPRSSVELVRPRTGSQASEDLESIQPMMMSTSTGGQVPMESIRERDDATDADGWVYGDNKWENMGAKGGLGRFTRRRRWHRRAVCTEIVQKIPSETTPQPQPKQQHQSPPQPLKSDATVAATPIISTPAIDGGIERPDVGNEEGERKREREGVSNIPTGTGATVRDDVLRQRLKKAMGSMGG